jgi:hypothetical protein
LILAANSSRPFAAASPLEADEVLSMKHVRIRRLAAGSRGHVAGIAVALGFVAVGALAIGALAVGRLAIRRIALVHDSIDRLTINDVDVARLRMREQVPSPQF